MNSNEDEKTINISKYIKQYDEFNKGLTKHYPNEEIFEKLIDYYEKKDNIKKIDEILGYVLHLYPYSSYFLIKKADLLISQERINDALNYLDKARALGVDDIEINVLLFECYVIKGDMKTAQNIAKRFIMQNSKQVQIDFLYEQVDILEENNYEEKLLDCLMDILRIAPSEEEALYKIFSSIQMTKMYEKGYVFFNQLTQNDLFNPLGWFNYGAICYELKLYEKAQEAYEYSIAIDSNYDFVYLNLSEVYIKLKKYKNAIVSLNEGFALNPIREVYYLKLLAQCYFSCKDYNSSIKTYKQVLKLNSRDHNAYFQVGKMYFAKKKYELSMAHIKYALTLKNNLSYFYFIANVYFKLEQYEKSFQIIVNVLHKRPKTKKYTKYLISLLPFLHDSDYARDTLDDLYTKSIISKGEFEIATKSIMKYRR